MTPVKVTINQEGALKKLNNLLFDCQWDLATPSIHNVYVYTYIHMHIFMHLSQISHLNTIESNKQKICPSKSSHRRGTVLSRNNNFQPKTSA